MAAIRLLWPAAPVAQLGTHRKATLAGPTLTVTFPYVDADGDLADLARNWVQQDRPGDRKPLTRPGPPRLAKVSLTALFASPDDNQRPVEIEMGILRALAGARDPVVASFGGLLGDTHWTASGRWLIDGLSFAVHARAHADNAVTKAEAHIDLLEANIPGWVPLASTFRYNSEIAGAGLGRPRTWLVTAGDTLWSIAWRVYGDPGRWIGLGDANGIVKPSDLTPGLVLFIP